MEQLLLAPEAEAEAEAEAEENNHILCTGVQVPSLQELSSHAVSQWKSGSGP